MSTMKIHVLKVAAYQAETNTTGILWQFLSVCFCLSDCQSLIAIICTLGTLHLWLLNFITSPHSTSPSQHLTLTAPRHTAPHPHSTSPSQHLAKQHLTLTAPHPHSTSPSQHLTTHHLTTHHLTIMPSSTTRRPLNPLQQQVPVLLNTLWSCDMESVN